MPRSIVLQPHFNSSQEWKMTMYRTTAVCLLAVLVLLAGCQTVNRSDVVRSDHARHARAPQAREAEPEQTQLAAPPAIRTEHEHLHEQLAAAQQTGGDTGDAAQAVAEAMAPHFEEEEA